MTATALDDYVTLGRSGLRVSPLALGGMTFGDELGWGASEAVSSAILDRYLERGGNFIDTAMELGATAASVALAWVRGRRGVACTLLGVRTPEQLEQNLASLSLRLTDEQIRRLDAVSEPQLPFPARMLVHAGSFMHGGITVNGDAAAPSPLGRTPDSPRF